MLRVLIVFLVVVLAGCDGRIYVRDGVTDGDTFYLAERALTDDDPVLQSWVAYSLSKSTCQLHIGGEIPSRVSTYGCEFTARSALIDVWLARGQSASDEYLDTLVTVRDQGYLREYVVHYFDNGEWYVPAEVDLVRFDQWRQTHLRRHRPVTRIIGSWNYRDPARRIAGDEH